MSKDFLNAVANEADQHAPVTFEEIEEKALSREARERLLALFLMRRAIDSGDPPEAYFPIAEKLVEDSENNCRWQALIVIGEAIETSPERVWNLARRHGDSEDHDMRLGVAKILLEHLLDFDFPKFFQLSKAEVKSGRIRFLDTLSECSLLDADNESRIRRYVRNANRGREDID